jgi:predicted AAA+ superfamily ATPase
VENIVCLELIRRGERPTYWRNKGEVDFVLGQRPGKLIPMGVCFSDDIPEREYNCLESFHAHVPPPLGDPMLLTRSLEGQDHDVNHLPVWRWLLRK